jgi:DNA-binding Lrp family transcriptional regulator
MVSAFVLVQAEPARIAELAESLADVEGVAEVYSTAGEADIGAVVRVRAHEDLAEVVTRGVNCLPGIVGTRLRRCAFRSYSRHDVKATWSLGEE